MTKLTKSKTSVPGLHVDAEMADPLVPDGKGSPSTIGIMGVGKIITPDVTRPVSPGEISGLL